MTQFAKRHAISRAHWFLDKAETCGPKELDEHEAYLEAAMVFSRTAIHRLQAQAKQHPSWQEWFDKLKGNPAVVFFRSQRDIILKEGPPKIGQVGIAIPPGADPNDPRFWPDARFLYYFDNPLTPAVDTIRRHLRELERVIQDGEGRFL